MRFSFFIGLLGFVLLALPLHAEVTQGLVLPFKEVSVSSPVLQDVIEEVLVKEGDVVTKGQVLARLLSDRETLQVQQAARVIEQKQFQAEGMAQLLKEKMASKETALEKQTDLELAKIQAKVAEVELAQKSIRAPLDGIVVKRYKEAGESVDRTEKMFDIVNIDQVYIQFYLPTQWLGKLETGRAVPVQVPALGGKAFTATVSFIDPRIDAASGLFRVKLLLDNPQHAIIAGMRATADFQQLLAGK